MTTPSSFRDIDSPQIEIEAAVHGARWSSIHGGYFSNNEASEALLNAVLDCAERSNADAVVDLGGGTGYMPARLRASRPQSGWRLINVEQSPEQLRLAAVDGLECIPESIDRFTRDRIADDKARCLFMMRSVMHYFGKSGLAPTLSKLRKLARPGEYFVHQSVSFQEQAEADCLNRLYELMGTRKWYPSTDVMRAELELSGWRVDAIKPAPALTLDYSELLLRYGFDQERVQAFCRELVEQTAVGEDVFSASERSCRFYLHYWIYVCTPLP
jgi:SAM-dependent methyltransferase